MLKLRDLEIPIEREIKEDDEVLGSEWLTQESYCTEGRYKSVPVSNDYDIHSENISLLSQLVSNLRATNTPRNVTYNDFTYSINEETKSSLRDISDLSDGTAGYEYEAENGVTIINGQDSTSIRKLMFDGVQTAFRKFKIVTDMITELESMEDIEAFVLLEEWVKA